jgi:hypothetical protein
VPFERGTRVDAVWLMGDALCQRFRDAGASIQTYFDLLRNTNLRTALVVVPAGLHASAVSPADADAGKGAGQTQCHITEGLTKVEQVVAALNPLIPAPNASPTPCNLLHGLQSALGLKSLRSEQATQVCFVVTDDQHATLDGCVCGMAIEPVTQALTKAGFHVCVLALPSAGFVGSSATPFIGSDQQELGAPHQALIALTRGTGVKLGSPAALGYAAAALVAEAVALDRTLLQMDPAATAAALHSANLSTSMPMASATAAKAVPVLAPLLPAGTTIPVVKAFGTGAAGKAADGGKDRPLVYKSDRLVLVSQPLAESAAHMTRLAALALAHSQTRYSKLEGVLSLRKAPFPRDDGGDDGEILTITLRGQQHQPVAAAGAKSQLRSRTLIYPIVDVSGSMQNAIPSLQATLCDMVDTVGTLSAQSPGSLEFLLGKFENEFSNVTLPWAEGIVAVQGAIRKHVVAGGGTNFVPPSQEIEAVLKRKIAECSTGDGSSHVEEKIEFIFMTDGEGTAPNDAWFTATKQLIDQLAERRVYVRVVFVGYSNPDAAFAQKVAGLCYSVEEASVVWASNTEQLQDFMSSVANKSAAKVQMLDCRVHFAKALRAALPVLAQPNSYRLTMQKPSATTEVCVCVCVCVCVSE